LRYPLIIHAKNSSGQSRIYYEKTYSRRRDKSVGATINLPVYSNYPFISTVAVTIIEVLYIQKRAWKE